MKDTHAAWFVGPLGVDTILAALRGAEEATWRIHESEYFGRYVKGRTSSGISVTIQGGDDQRYLVEVFFPTREGRGVLDGKEKRSFVTWLEALLASAGLRKTATPTGT